MRDDDDLGLRARRLRGHTAFICVSMRLDERTTMVFCLFIYLLSSKVTIKNIDFTKKQLFCVTCPGKVKMWTRVEKIGYVEIHPKPSVRRFGNALLQ